MKTFKCHSDKSTQTNDNKNSVYVAANVMIISPKLQLHPLMAFAEKIFLANLAFYLSWQPMKYSGLDKIHLVGRTFQGTFL